MNEGHRQIGGEKGKNEKKEGGGAANVRTKIRKEREKERTSEKRMEQHGRNKENRGVPYAFDPRTSIQSVQYQHRNKDM